ncbi:MAG: glycoside hydrolase family 3 protein [Clostridiales bacterium]|jgi:beta-N-acetylhexosaminidase|nr:glycoside hydrolase family 3 protein [Clostridiales bacterium]
MIDLKNSPFYLSDGDIEWVLRTLDGMTDEEKIGQLFCPLGITGSRRALKRLTREIGVGGIMYRPSKAANAQKIHAFLQSDSKIPLLIAGNLESGGNGAAAEGTNFGMPLQVAATGDSKNAYRLGAVACSEGAAIGLNWAFAPVVDVDLNFRNPITNLRTFGSGADTVIDMAGQYIRAASERGVAACIKHFPGDGADERDQHLVTSVNDLTCGEWDKIYGKIYSALIAGGIKSIMVGHIAQPAYQEFFDGGKNADKIIPATLSKELMTDLLRGRLGFNGLTVSDASSMTGFRSAMKREDAVPLCIASGADMFLFNRDGDYEYMLKGYRGGVITKQRLDEAVTRILALKASLRLHVKAAQGSLVPPIERIKTDINSPQARLWAAECADKSVTLVKDTQGLLPLSPSKYKRVYLNVLEPDDDISSPLRRALKERLERAGFTVAVRDRAAIAGLQALASPSASVFKKAAALFKARKAIPELIGPSEEFISKYDLVIYAANFETASDTTVIRINWKGFKGMGNDAPWFAAELPVVFISLANPYHLLDVPMIKTYINAYTNSPAVLDTVVDKITGGSRFEGVSPVDAFCGRKDTAY